MQRNNYDSDVTLFSPQGRVYQVEYALEAVKQGSAAIGVRSKSHVVLVALKRQAGALASYQQKIVKVDDHTAVAISGLTSDARVLSSHLRTEANRSRILHGRRLPVNRFLDSLAEKAQYNSQRYWLRPYGIGLLVAGADDFGPHLFEFQPSGVVLEYYAMAIGARSQSAKTYLEDHVDEFADASLDALVMHAVTALRYTLPQDQVLTSQNTSVGIIGLDASKGKDLDSQLEPLRTLDDDLVTPYLERLGPRTSAPVQPENTNMELD